jgi:hypothetical protein
LSTKRENKSCRRNRKKYFVDDTGKKNVSTKWENFFVDETGQLSACRPNGPEPPTLLRRHFRKIRS